MGEAGVLPHKGKGKRGLWRRERGTCSPGTRQLKEDKDLTLTREEGRKGKGAPSIVVRGGKVRENPRGGGGWGTFLWGEGWF